MECTGKRAQWLHKVRSSETFIVIVVSIAIFTVCFYAVCIRSLIISVPFDGT